MLNMNTNIGSSINMNINGTSTSTSSSSAAKNALQLSMDMSKQAAESLFSNHLASALSTISDSQFFQDSISPTTIRSQFQSADPSNPSSTPTLLNSMKWLLASMSKGRNVSDFFPSVVKLVSCPNLELRRMVYMYLVHYADHDATCRDLALLSINAFQRGLSDSEQWIRSLALRVLTSIRVNDVIQIQILAVQTCSKDSSPYVRKCSSNALSKLYHRCNIDNQKQILDILKKLLIDEKSTMVLSSLMFSFVEICPDQLDMLHACYRKLCHLLTDMDEWGQVVVMDVLTRYCRTFFCKPNSSITKNKGGTYTFGSAEVIDRQRRVVRRINKYHPNGISVGVDGDDSQSTLLEGEIFKRNNNDKHNTVDVLVETNANTTTFSQKLKQTKRNIVKKGFYSDDEDDSSNANSDDDEDDDYLIPNAAIIASKNQSVAGSMRQHNVLGFGDGITGIDGNYGPHGVGGVADATGAVDEDEALDEDHRLLLRSCLPLLKSRNSGVVLGVCSLHYYCGVASIKIRSALGKALVRIYHDRREIQFVVLNSIRTLVWECPSAFTPFLNSFFVKAMDPSFTRLIKLDILSALALEPNSINAVLKELRTYIRHDDKEFVCASIKAVGKIVEMAKIVYDRQGVKTGNDIAMREEGNVIVLNCLHGILTLMESSSHKIVVGECIGVAQRIIALLQSTNELRTKSKSSLISDPSNIQYMSLRRLVLLVFGSLSMFENGNLDSNDYHYGDDDIDTNKDALSLQKQILVIPNEAIGPALWIIGECVCSDDNSTSYSTIFQSSVDERQKILSELLRLLAKYFTEMDSLLKCHCIHFASKMIISNETLRNGQSSDRSFCEYILALGRVDVNKDVRDRSRNESLLIHMSIGLQYDAESLPSVPSSGTKISIETVKSLLLQKKPSSSWLPIENDSNISRNDGNGIGNAFRFGTLSSMVSHKAGLNYLPLPPWAESDSPKTLRDPPQLEPPSQSILSTKKDRIKAGNTNKANNKFYESESESSSSSSDDSDSDESSSESSSSSSSSSSSDSSSSDSDSSNSSSGSSGVSVGDESTSSEEETKVQAQSKPIKQMSTSAMSKSNATFVPIISSTEPLRSMADSSDDDDEESDSASDTSTESEQHMTKETNAEKSIETLIDVSYNQSNGRENDDARNTNQSNNSTESVSEGLEGLVMAPLKIKKEDDPSNCDVEKESNEWTVLVRHDLSGGLLVTTRFLRGLSRKQELLLLGLDPKNTATVCVQMKFENKRTDGLGIRRIRLMQRNVSSSGTIPTTRAIIPQEIDILNSSQISFAMIGLEFAQHSDKDGAFHTRFDIKCDRSSTSVDIRPPLAELLLESKIMSIVDFDESMQKMHGIHQQAMSKFELSPSSKGSSISLMHEKLPVKILKASTLVLVGNKKWKNNCCRFVGALPASGKDVLVRIRCDKNSGAGELAICCDSAIALNSLLAFLKKAILH